MSKVLEARYGSPDRPLKIGEFEIPCYVLSNEKRVITQSGFLKALGIQYRGETDKKAEGEDTPARLVRFINGKRINPFISNELKALLENPIKFQNQTGSTAYGYEATCLVDVCDAVIQARKAGQLQKQQHHIAERAEALIRAFAKTGIIALIDEVTGFQTVREKDALQQFLGKFLLEEHAKWVKTFPDEFFEMIFRMKGWTWHFASTKKPQVVGHYVNDFVYSRIAPQVLKELRELNPKIDGKRKAKHTQFITTDYGHPKLKEHLTAITALGRATGYNWNNFIRFINRAFPKFAQDGSQAVQIPFNED
jgi:hypothetical protein